MEPWEWDELQDVEHRSGAWLGPGEAAALLGCRVDVIARMLDRHLAGQWDWGLSVILDGCASKAERTALLRWAYGDLPARCDRLRLRGVRTALQGPWDERGGDPKGQWAALEVLFSRPHLAGSDRSITVRHAVALLQASGEDLEGLSRHPWPAVRSAAVALERIGDAASQLCLSGECEHREPVQAAAAQHAFALWQRASALLPGSAICDLVAAAQRARLSRLDRRTVRALRRSTAPGP